MAVEIEVLFEDGAILVADKPAGWLSAPDRYDPELPVVARELEMEHGRLWPVHRLDKDTSGVLLFARDEATHRALSTAFEERRVRKAYMAAVRGRPTWDETVCELALTPDGDKLHRTVVDGAGKPSVTEFKVAGVHGKMALVVAKPLTGRSHQIRVHLAALGYPVACDPLYGDGKPVFLSEIKRRWKGDEAAERPLISRCALHAASIELAHPTTGAELRFEAPYPKDMRALVTQLGKL